MSWQQTVVIAAAVVCVSALLVATILADRDARALIVRIVRGRRKF